MTYPGGKGASGVAQTIINQQPPHSTYLEPFAGGASVARLKLPADTNILVDADGEQAAALRLEFHQRFLVCRGDAMVYINHRADDPHCLIYCDPPYPLTARRRNRRLYRYEMTDVDHRRLLRAILEAKCMVQISSYWNPLYAEMLEGWRLVRFMANTRGGLVEECLWMNYPEPTALHDYRFLGGTFRERERIRRKTARWTARVAGLPKLERLALLSAMTASNSNFGVAGSRLGRRRDPAASTMPAIGDRVSPTQTEWVL